jgi:hypothetical protein
MPSAFEYAILSDDSYRLLSNPVTGEYGESYQNKFISLPAGWAMDLRLESEEFISHLQGLGYSVPTLSGFNARTYKNNATGEVVIAFRGTEGSNPTDPGDLVTDALLASGIVLDQVALAYHYTQWVKGQLSASERANLTFTGHSLGGGFRNWGLELGSESIKSRSSVSTAVKKHSTPSGAADQQNPSYSGQQPIDISRNGG